MFWSVFHQSFLVQVQLQSNQFSAVFKLLRPQSRPQGAPGHLTYPGCVAGERDTSWDTTYCHSPGYLSGKAVSQVREEQLVCDSKEEAQDFKISPDVKFREVETE